MPVVKRRLKDVRMPFSTVKARVLRRKPDRPEWLTRARETFVSPNTRRGYDYWNQLYLATPWWVCNHYTAIRDFYRNCPIGYEVDHIVPLNHPYVCGLHVPWNLQYLPADENRSKSNHTWPDCPHEIVDMFGREPQQLRIAL